MPPQVDGSRGAMCLCPCCCSGCTRCSGPCCPSSASDITVRNRTGPAAPSTGKETHRLSDICARPRGAAARLSPPCVAVPRWRMRSSLSDRIYIFLILVLCFGLPSFVIIASYVSILVTVRSAITDESLFPPSPPHCPLPVINLQLGLLLVDTLKKKPLR